MGVLQQISDKIRRWRNSRDKYSYVQWGDFAHQFETLKDVDVTEVTNMPGWVIGNQQAGGDLTGYYPDPELVDSGVTAGTYGDSTNIPRFTVDSKGRITYAVNIPISGGGGSGGADFSLMLMGG